MTNTYIGLRAGLALLAVALAAAACTTAAPDQNDKVAGTIHVCSSCHGVGGNSVSPTFPRLAGQQQAYLVTQLKAFRDHTRADPHAHTYMWGMAARLDDQTIAGVAAYYASQKPVEGRPRDPALMAAGKIIFEQGNVETGVPACAGCHGDKAQGMDAFPRLAGQHADYLKLQLQAFSANTRANEMMHDNSKNLTEPEISQLAAYLASL
jgi:cytochrome c553